MVMARGIPVASARGFRGRTAPPTPLRVARPKSPRRKPVGMTRPITHGAVGPPTPQKPPAEAGGMPRPIPIDAVGPPHAPKAPGGSRLGCRAPSPTTPLGQCPELKRPENKTPDRANTRMVMPRVIPVASARGFRAALILLAHCRGRWRVG